MIKRRVGVLIHGYNLLEENWEEVVWGRPPLMGRLPRGALIALYLDAEIIVFGTGATERDGKKEAEVMRDYLLDHFSELKEFPAFQGIDLKAAKKKIEEVSRVEIESTNTIEEVYCAGKIFLEAGVESIILVSSPDHLPRCFRDVHIVFSENKDFHVFAENLFGTSCQTFYGTNRMPLVVESSHECHPFLQRTMRVSAADREKFLFALENLLEEFSL